MKWTNHVPFYGIKQVRILTQDLVITPQIHLKSKHLFYLWIVFMFDNHFHSILLP